LCIATVAEATKAEEREWAASLLAVVFTQSTRQLHLVAAFLANLLVASESSTPHTEPAVDGRCLRATTPAVFLRSPVDLKVEHDIWCDMKNNRVRMIVKWCRGRSEGSRDGSYPRDFINSHT